MRSNKLRMAIARITTVSLLVLLTLGFKIFGDKIRWNITDDDPYLWVQFCNADTRNQVFGDGTFPPNDELGDETNITFQQLAATVINDVN